MAGVYEQLTTNLQRKIYQKITTSEVSGPLNGNAAYKLSHAGTASSGYSFGWIQWDLAQPKDNPDVFNIISDAVKNISDDKFNSVVTRNNLQGTRLEIEQEIINALRTTQGAKDTGVEQFRNLIDEQLVAQSERIDSNTAWDIKNVLEQRITDVVAQITDSENKIFVEGSLITQLFIADIKNQFGSEVNSKFVRYLNGEEVKPNYNGGLLVQIQGGIGIEDIIRYHLSTKYAQTTSGEADCLRRFSNIIETSGIGITAQSLTSEDKTYFPLCQYK